MKITLKSAHGYLSAQPPTPHKDGTPNPTGPVRWQYRDAVGPWEQFELEGFVLQPAVPETPPDVVPPPAKPPIPPDPGEGCARFAQPGAEALLVACFCEEIQPRGSAARALEVLGQVAWALRAAGAGLLAKPAGENIADYHGVLVSISRIAIRPPTGDLQLYKILSDVPTTNGAQWNDDGPAARDRWVAPVRPSATASIYKK